MISAKMESNYYPSVLTERKPSPSFQAWSSSVLLPHTTGLAAAFRRGEIHSKADNGGASSIVLRSSVSAVSEALIPFLNRTFGNPGVRNAELSSSPSCH